MFWHLLLIHADPAEKMTDVEIKKAILGQKPAGPLLKKDVITGGSAKREPTIGEVARRMKADQVAADEENKRGLTLKQLNASKTH